MPTIDIKNWDNKTVGSVDLPEEIFAYPYKEHLVHEAVRNDLASLRQGTHKTKVRSEVSGSNKKPFRQKGTGRARQGGARPPIHRHGGQQHLQHLRDSHDSGGQIQANDFGVRAFLRRGGIIAVRNENGRMMPGATKHLVVPRVDELMFEH